MTRFQPYDVTRPRTSTDHDGRFGGVAVDGHSIDGMQVDGIQVDGIRTDGFSSVPGPSSELVDQLTAELQGLRERQLSLAVIEQAKGMLMAHYAVTADVAFAVLRRWSQNGNVKVRGPSVTAGLGRFAAPRGPDRRVGSDHRRPDLQPGRRPRNGRAGRRLIAPSV